MSEDLIAFINIDIPASLRPISMFLGEAQKAMRGHVSSSSNEETALSYKKITVCAINHALKLLSVNETHVDDAAQQCINQFQHIRNLLANELTLNCPMDSRFNSVPKLKIVVSHAEDILVAEAIEIMEFAEEQWDEGMRQDACRNFHAAAVYLRVLESIVPSMSSEIHHRLEFAAKKVRESSSLKQNFVREHFSGSSCAQFYDVHGRNKLGKGSYGSVYLATNRITGDDRAVKVMNVDRVTSYYLKKLHTEIEILREVDHPNIIKLQDVFFGRRSVYLVTSLCRGGELYELLTSGKNQGFVFREDRAARLMKDMISAVKYLHSIGIVHRDLKLENFLFQGESSSSPLILIDFGLSKHFDSTERMRQRVGSCYYTAPEVLSGDYDYRCDLWSLGVICYMLLSGSPPFFGKTPDDIHNSTLTKEAEYPERRFKHVSPIGIDFMRRLLVKNPDLRMTSTEALEHPFIKGPTARMSSAVMSRPPSRRHIVLPDPLLDIACEIAESLRIFASLPMLTKLVIQLVSCTLSTEQIARFRSEFHDLDHDESGTLSLAEIQALGSPVQASEFAEIFLSIVSLRQLPSHDSGSTDSEEANTGNLMMTYSEYIAAAMCGRLNISTDRAGFAFSVLDSDRKGVITAETISQVMGVDIDLEALRQDMTSLKAHFEDAQSRLDGAAVDGIDKATFMKAWHAVGFSNYELLLRGDSSSMDESSIGGNRSIQSLSTRGSVSVKSAASMTSS